MINLVHVETWSFFLIISDVSLQRWEAISKSWQKTKVLKVDEV
ncbi:MAG: hypothetical protein PUP91_27475 [Rhizonema sp. PD37]|nr:hypothetical protein [Rhizonema sp. PD37]